MNAPLARLAEIALRDVLPPGAGRNVVDLGLIHAVTATADGAVSIVVNTAMRGCPSTGFLKRAVAIAAGGVEGVTAVAVSLSREPARKSGMIAAARR